MSGRRSCERLNLLQNRVQKIALGCILLHVIGFSGEVIQVSTSKNNEPQKDQERFERRAILSIISESMVGLLTSILLYCGAKRQNKYMLVPFMLIMVLLQAFLVITIFLFITLCLTGECSSGDPLIYFYLALLFILISITCWLLRTTKSLFDELRKDDDIGSPAEPQDVPNALEPQNMVRQPTWVAIPGANSAQIDLESNDSSLRANLPIPNVNNSNQEVDHSETIDEPPPDYNLATAITNSMFRSIEPPPLYEDVIKKEQTVLFRGTNDFT